MEIIGLQPLNSGTGWSFQVVSDFHLSSSLPIIIALDLAFTDTVKYKSLLIFYSSS